MNFVDHLLFYMKLLNYLFCDMFGSVKIAYSFRRFRRRNQISIRYNMVDVVIGVTVRRFFDYNVFIKTNLCS